MNTPGFHHFTMFSGHAAATVRFYRDVLGLRMVKTTVNFDDPGTWHLYFADRVGTPGTSLTFFPWEGTAPARRGHGSIDALTLRVPPGSLPAWAARLQTSGIPAEPADRFGEPILITTDPDGLQIELIEAKALPGVQPWGGNGVAADHAITGVHSVTALLWRSGASLPLLTQVMGLQEVAREGRRIRLAFDPDQAEAGYYDLVEAGSGTPRHQQGAGAVHHIAFRAPGDEHQEAWRSRLGEAGFHPTPVIDRQYFHSIYFRERSGILFEIATDQPGFTIDEAEPDLGTSLVLPPQHEPLRARIEAALPPLEMKAEPAAGNREAGADVSALDSHKHLWVRGDLGDHPALLALHGTGGSESDLLPLAARMAPGWAVLSPRGNVSENGMARFFRRHAEGVFDIEDLHRRTGELAEFLAAATNTYPLDRGLVALGYSNGANIAASLLLSDGDVLRGAVLLRPMLPFQPGELPDLAGVPVLILAGEHDSMIPGESTLALEQQLRDAGAEVEIHWLPTGHGLTDKDLQLATDWLARRRFRSEEVASAPATAHA